MGGGIWSEAKVAGKVQCKAQKGRQKWVAKVHLMAKSGGKSRRQDLMQDPKGRQRFMWVFSQLCRGVVFSKKLAGGGCQAFWAFSAFAGGVCKGFCYFRTRNVKSRVNLMVPSSIYTDVKTGLRWVLDRHFCGLGATFDLEQCLRESIGSFQTP